MVDRLKLLVVEDEDDLRDLLAFHLKDDKTEILTASTADEGLQIYKNNADINGVVTDIRTPGKLNGLQMVRSIQEFNRSSPKIVIMTGNMEIGEKDIKDLNILSVYYKPCHLRDTVKMIKREILVALDPVQDLRRFTRFNKVGFVRIVSGPPAAKILRATNVSQGGLFLEMPQPIPIGSTIEVAVEVDGQSINATAEVRWIRPASPSGKPAGVGLEFKAFDTKDPSTIEKIFNR